MTLEIKKEWCSVVFKIPVSKAMGQKIERVVTFAELPNYGINYSRSWLRRLEKAGLFPKRVCIGSYRVGWLEHEIVAHQQTFMERSDRIGELGSAKKITRRQGICAPRRNADDC